MLQAASQSYQPLSRINIATAERTKRPAKLSGGVLSASPASRVLLRADWILQAPDGTRIALTFREFAFMDCLLSCDA